MSEHGGAIALRPEDESLTVSEVHGRVQRVQQVMKGLMKEGTHYGTIPGTQKPTLYSAGADLIGVTFQIALSPEIVEERLGDDEVEYRVKVTATSQATERFLGAAEGVCSTREKKYRWRRPVHLKEWEAADPLRRRVYWDSKGEEYKQVRQEPGDVANTILQMAVKRGKVAVVRVVTGCSDIFAQNLEDVSPEMLSEEDVKAAPGMPQAQKPATDASPATPAGIPGENPNGTLTPLQVRSVKKAKEGESAKGRWTLYVINTDGGEFVTFSDTVAKNAGDAQTAGASVFIRSKPTPKGGQEVVELTKVAAA